MKLEEYVNAPIAAHRQALIDLRALEDQRPDDRVSVDTAMRIAAAVYYSCRQPETSGEVHHNFTVDKLGNRQYRVDIGEHLNISEQAG